MAVKVALPLASVVTFCEVRNLLPSRRFVVFAIDRYEAAGGWQDFQASYDTREEAMATPLRRYFSWAEVVDLETGECTTHDVEPKTYRIKPGPCTP